MDLLTYTHIHIATHTHTYEIQISGLCPDQQPECMRARKEGRGGKHTDSYRGDLKGLALLSWDCDWNLSSREKQRQRGMHRHVNLCCGVEMRKHVCDFCCGVEMHRRA